LELGVRPHDTLAAPPSVELRLLEPDDWPSVSAIYWDGMRDGLATFETEVPPWDVWDAGHLFDHRLVADLLGEVVGWAALSPWNSRCGYAGTVEASVYVRQDSHRRGLGRALLADLIARAKSLGHHVIVGGASSDQSASLALQMALGFVPVGTFREVGYKFGRRLDVTYSQLILSGG
jgi:phosphinothricin acetyltransferase